MSDRPHLTLRWRWFAGAMLAGLVLWGVAGLIVEQMAFGAGTRCETTTCLRRALTWDQQQRRVLERRLAVRYQPDVRAAIELASRISGVSFERLWVISGCESRHDPYNVLGQYQGLFQLGAYHRSLPDIRGLDPFNPYVNAMHAALFIAKHGESQWSCRSDGRVAY